MRAVPPSWQPYVNEDSPRGRKIRKALSRTPPQRMPAYVPPVSDVGSRLRVAWEEINGVKMTCGECLRYLRSLDYERTPDQEKIAIKLSRELPFSVDLLKRFPRYKDRLEFVRNFVFSTVPVISDVGIRLRVALEMATDSIISCGDCLLFLSSLNSQKNHDKDKIVYVLYRDLPIPIRIRERGNMRGWLSGIVDSVLEGDSKDGQDANTQGKPFPI